MRKLFDKVDNTKLVLFRILFGILMMAEGWGAIATGWVKETFVDPDFTFNFIGFDWTQIFLGEGMYVIYLIIGLLGLLIMLGTFYRLSTIILLLLWSLTYFMQKSHYNNHYYFLIWICLLMCIVPANSYYSIDCNLNSKISSKVCSRYNILLFQILVTVLYFFAALAKIYPGWIDNHYLPMRLSYSAKWFDKYEYLHWFANFLRNKELAQFLSYAGIAFDFLIVPLLLFKPTRKIAFFSALFFHIFNSVTLQIGIFPYLALAMTFFFFDTKYLNKELFPFKQRASLYDEKIESPLKKRIIVYFFICFVFIQVTLPLRHWLIKDDVLWTEEGHRLSWRMMLRSKSGYLQFETHLPNGNIVTENVYEYLQPHQISEVYTKPDCIWQFVQLLKKKYKEKGVDTIQVFAKKSTLSINGGPPHPFINPTIDLAKVKWHYFTHTPWILPSPDNYYD